MKYLILLLLVSCASKYHVICKDRKGRVKEYFAEKIGFTKTQFFMQEGNTHTEEQPNCKVQD